MENISLQRAYNNAVHNYLKEFCKKQEIDYDEFYWIGGKIGEHCDYAGEYIFDFKDIKTDVDNKAEKGEILKWSNYCTRLLCLGAESVINYSSWLSGAPRKSEDELIRLEEAKYKIRQLQEDLEKQIKEARF